MTANRLFDIFGLLLLAATAMCPGNCLAQAKSAARSKFVLSSPDAQLAAKVPEVYTANLFGCSGGNMSPPLQWSGEPTGTKSFVVTLFDPDEHGDPSGWWHWIVYNLPANTHTLPKGAGTEQNTALRSPQERCKGAPISATTLITGPALIRETRRTATRSLCTL
jgi:phosphatidylethanolamine-binding protein (PEBP) family uncharacterized protein